MRLTALILLFVVVAQGSNFRRPLSKTKQMEAFAEIDTKPIGSMIMSQLQIHLASEGVVDDVLGLVTGLVGDLNTAQEHADALHNQDVATCEHEISTSQAKWDHHVAERDNALQTVADTQGLLSTAENELEQTLVDIVDLNRQIAEGTALRADQAAAYAVSQAKHQRALDALDEAIPIISAVAAGGSFFQLKNKISKVTSQLQELTHLTEYSAYGPMIESLVELSTSNQSGNAVHDIVELLSQLRAQIQHTKDVETSVENARISAWRKLLSELTTQRNNAVNRKNTLEANISNYKVIITMETASAQMHDELQARFQDLNAMWKQDCAQRQSDYEVGTAARTGDLDVLGRLQAYLQENLSKFEDYLMDRVNTF